MAASSITLPSPSTLNLLPLRTPFHRSPPLLTRPLLRSSLAGATTDTAEPDPSDSVPPDADADEFETRLNQVRIRYRSGQGKKAELRKARKSKKGGGGGGGRSSSGPGSGMYLPAVPLKEPVSEGLVVRFGFNPYSERVNGRAAMLGLMALLLVEMATGKSLVRYHTPPIVFVQLYFVAAVSAVYFKFVKERVSVWPQSSPPSNS